MASRYEVSYGSYSITSCHPWKPFNDAGLNSLNNCVNRCGVRNNTWRTCFARHVLDVHVFMNWTCPAHFASKGHANIPSRELLFVVSGSENRGSSQRRSWMQSIVAPQGGATSQGRMISVKFVPTARLATRWARSIGSFFVNSLIRTRSRNISGVWNPIFARDTGLQIRRSVQCLKRSHTPRLNSFKTERLDGAVRCTGTIV
jgi:hypothetical protein